jgi:acetate---CoA ligase (ADP-forming)
MLNRNRMIETASLDKIIRPKSVAIIGASPQRGTARNSIVRVLLKHGFQGHIYPVNPSHPEIEGLKAYASVEQLPEVPNVALIVTPANTVADIISQCGTFGIRAAIVYSSGFEEIEGGKQHARRLAQAAKEHDVTVLGANCQGVWSVRERAMLTFGGASLALESLKHAPIAVISQSGALAGAIGNYLQNSGMGCSYIVSVGNETCLDLLDVLSWLIEQDDVRVVALYLEALVDAGRIVRIAERARERGIQIVAVKTGRSAVGQQATASHTGKIASSHAVYADVLEQAGVLAVGTLAEVLAAVEVLAFLPDPRVSGDPKGGVSVMSSSGGAGALLADHGDEFGIPMAEFSSETAKKLDPILPEFARKVNPVDLTGQIRRNPNLFKDACAAISADPRTEAMVVQFASGGLQDLRENGEAFKFAAREGGFPMVISTVAETIDPQTRQEFREAGVLLSGDTAATMRALSWLYKRQSASKNPKTPTNRPPPHRTAPTDWAEIMDFCAASSIQPAKWRVLGARDSVATACAGMSYPLVVKVLPSDSDHKTELGLVKLRVKSPEEVEAHATDFRKRLGKPDLKILLQEMVDGGIEVVIACLRNTDFGPVISIGTGGVAIELFRDVTHLALPVSPQEVLAALKKLKLWTLLQGYRGQPPADIEALVRAAVNFGDMFLATPELTEFEINPLLVRREGDGVIAVDALVVTGSKLPSDLKSEGRKS